jgi:SOS-response transcriptional repressor LexA
MVVGAACAARARCDGDRVVERVPLTERQRSVLEFITGRLRATGYPPSLREIGAALEIRSTNGVSDHLRALERKGYVRRHDSVSRGLQVLGVAS